MKISDGDREGLKVLIGNSCPLLYLAFGVLPPGLAGGFADAFDVVFSFSSAAFFTAAFSSVEPLSPQ